MNTRISSLLAAGISAALCLIVLSGSPVVSAEESQSEAKFKVSGNCGQCKKRIEKAVKMGEVTSAKWSSSTKMLTIAYDPGKITLDSLQQRVAAAGHDTERFKAPDSTYASLPACCLYRGGGKSH
jgi:periplasmic mercuric ion binding protein